MIPNDVVSCKGCPFRDAMYVPGDGSQFCKMMVIGSSPGLVEEKSRTPFTGPSGQLVRDVFADIGVEAFFTNVMKRKPDGKPTKADCWRCGSHLVEEITFLQPKVILTLGQFPLQFFHGNIPTVSTIRGLPLKTVRCAVEFKLVPTYDPSHVLRRGGMLSEIGDQFVSDIEMATELFDELR